MTEELRDEEMLYRVVLRRALTTSNPEQLTLHFEAGVLDRYREKSGFSIIRTDTVGRVRKQGGWMLDFGIAPDEEMIHATYAQLIVLPEEERIHFAAFARLPLASRMFISMRMEPGACYDDGEIRKWEAAPSDAETSA